LRKAKKSPKVVQKSKVNENELSLMRHFIHFPEVVVDASKNYSPNLICKYLFDLAQKYNNFYNENKIIGDENENLRLSLTKATAQILKNGLNLLGIEVLEKM
jgi:arginyl-tRNA synthetase